MSEIQPNAAARPTSKPATASSAAAPASASGFASAAPAAKPLAPAIKPEMIDPQELQRKLEEAVKRLNEQMQDNRRQLGFSVDDRLNRQVVRVTNQETGELVRQIPSEVVIRVANSIENLKGVLFDKEF
jgi:flagellar protein FlaG